MGDEWQIDAVDVDEYLARIGHPRVTPSEDALRTLHEAHVRAIPFENIDVVLEQHPGIELPVIVDKIVRRGRGGYCFEHALLFAAVLERLGFDVQRRLARTNPDRRGYRSHILLRVRVEGVDYLADVGFGRGVLHPMPLRDGAVVDQAGWPHRLVRQGALWVLEKQTPEGWLALHASDETPQHFTDFEMSHHFVSTHPNSPFTGQLVVMRLDHGICRRLVGNTLTTDYATGESGTTEITPDSLETTLHNLDIILPPAELAALKHFQQLTT